MLYCEENSLRRVQILKIMLIFFLGQLNSISYYFQDFLIKFIAIIYSSGSMSLLKFYLIATTCFRKKVTHNIRFSCPVDDPPQVEAMAHSTVPALKKVLLSYCIELAALGKKLSFIIITIGTIVL